MTTDYDQGLSSAEEEDPQSPADTRRLSSINSVTAGASSNTEPTEYSNRRTSDGIRPGAQLHVPLDLVVVVPVSSSMQGLKIALLKDTLQFLVANLGPRDRMGVVTFGSGGGGVSLVGMTTKAWNGWSQVLESIKPLGQKNLRADVVEGANVAMDLLMQRKSTNALSSILLISDSSASEQEIVDFVISRAEAAKVTISSFGLGLTHKPDAMIELSTRTQALYTYVKDWNALRECVAGCLGSLQSISHQNAKLKLHLPDSSSATFVKASGAMHVTKRSTGKDIELVLGNLRFGDKREILVQLAIEPDNMVPQSATPRDPWESIVSGLEALGGSDSGESEDDSVEEVPLLQADLAFGDITRNGHLSHLPRPTLLTIPLLPAPGESDAAAPSEPPHSSVVRRRMELLTSDMLTRALALASKGQHERAHQLLSETRNILKSLSSGRSVSSGQSSTVHSGPQSPRDAQSPTGEETQNTNPTRSNENIPIEATGSSFSGVDEVATSALDTELASSLEWINHPAVFGRDARKGVLQAIGVISSQRAYTFRTPIENLWAQRIPGIKRISEREREWRDQGTDDALPEE